MFWLVEAARDSFVSFNSMVERRCPSPQRMESFMRLFETHDGHRCVRGWQILLAMVPVLWASWHYTGWK